jgi:hypothetical protein
MGRCSPKFVVVAAPVVAFWLATKETWPLAAAVADTAPPGVAVASTDEDEHGGTSTGADLARFVESLVASHIAINPTASGYSLFMTQPLVRPVAP